MRKFAALCVAVCVSLSVAGCGKSKEEEARVAAEEAQKAAVEAQKAAAAAVAAGAEAAAAGAQAGAAGAQAGAAGAQAAQGMAEFAKGMAQFGQAMQGLGQSSDGQVYTPVSFRDLQALLPELPGWERSTPTGEMMTAPVKFSQTEAKYTKGQSYLEIKIVDTAMSALLTMPYQMFLASGYMKESSNGFEKATSFSGNPGWLKWSGLTNHAEAGVIVGKRFLVTIDARGVESSKPLEDAINRIDASKLAALK